MNLTVRANSESQTMDVARTLASVVRGGDVLELRGELGAGKTRFVKGLAAGIGLDARHVSSPTFAIVNEYADTHAALRLLHVDAYRLDGDALDELGVTPDADTVLAIEWPGRSALDIVDGPRWIITLEHTGETARRITIEAPRPIDQSMFDGIDEDQSSSRRA